MIVNLKKTEIIVFRNGGPLRHYERWKLNVNVINVTSLYKYMGIVFTPKLSWTPAKEKLAAQARKAIYSINNYRRKFGYFSHNEYFKLVDAIVKPILTYGAEIWGFEHAEVIEQVQIQFCKQFLGVNNSVNNSVALGECGRLPLCISYHVKCIKYWCKLLQMPDHLYPKNCYIMLKSQDDIGRNNWVTSVKMLLFRYGFGFAWLSQDVGNINIFVRLFKVAFPVTVSFMIFFYGHFFV